MREITEVAKITIYAYSQLSEEDKKLIDLSIEAVQGAYAPYSNFGVGAAVLLSNGKIVIGNNQENEAFPSGMCAERVALYSASAQNPKERICTIAISAYDKNRDCVALSFPCGACRQVMMEYEKRQNSPIRILISAGEEVYVAESVKSFMPFSFSM
ncbi:MAG: cytidine deaminase [Bacteroidales bacterium]|nr:cytidine deaminase [Bacteroidales bacterium]MBQ7819649.1 cytidine deaminase [Bacteroidales bacterium]